MVLNPAWMHRTKSLAAEKFEPIMGFMKRKCWPALGAPLSSITSTFSSTRLSANCLGLLTVAESRMNRGLAPYDLQSRLSLRMSWFMWEPKIPL